MPALGTDIYFARRVGNFQELTHFLKATNSVFGAQSSNRLWLEGTGGGL